MISNSAAYLRHDISNEVLPLIRTAFSCREGIWRGEARDNRQFVNVWFRILITGRAKNTWLLTNNPKVR
ncbi:hypothetical protein C8R27_12052 [Nitrosomonas ureae]|nr:hypothetical protein C8R27_12052 [Nitrosomonas ureae]